MTLRAFGVGYVIGALLFDAMKATLHRFQDAEWLGAAMGPPLLGYSSGSSFAQSVVAGTRPPSLRPIYPGGCFGGAGRARRSSLSDSPEGSYLKLVRDSKALGIMPNRSANA
jgi:hypothetical protein